MSGIRLNIDGREVVAKEGMTVLEAARSAGVPIPTLCHHEGLATFGGCRLCIVEAKAGAGSRLLVSCVYPAEAGLEIRTRSEKVDRIRKTLLELLLAHAPDSPALRDLAKEYGTPLFILSENTIRTRIRRMQKAFDDVYPNEMIVCVGMKAN
jgi:predicted molibdopterin-dependent oxidoreductase YjgC